METSATEESRLGLSLAPGPSRDYKTLAEVFEA